MHSVCMQALCNRMNLVRIPRRDPTYLANCMCNSRRDRGRRSRSPKCCLPSESSRELSFVYNDYTGSRLDCQVSRSEIS